MLFGEYGKSRSHILYHINTAKAAISTTARTALASLIMTISPQGSQRPIDLHAFAEQFMIASGGVPVESSLPRRAGRKRADILFPEFQAVAEIKSITNDRSIDPNVKEAMNALLTEKGPSLGGPIIFGTVDVRLDKLPEKLAKNAYRLLAQRVQSEVTTANRQIRETVEDIGYTDPYGTLVIIVPPMGIDLHLIGWAVNDAIRDGRHSSLDGLVMIECDAPDETTRNLVVTHHRLREREMPRGLLRNIREGLQRIVKGPLRQMREEDFFRRYEIEPPSQ